MNPPGTTRGQTQTHVRQLLSLRGLSPRTALGQCFLTDLNLLDLLVQAADLRRDDFVLEIGAGTGSLTARLAAQAGSVLAVEIDPGLFELARDAVQSCTNVRVLHRDILDGKHAIDPQVLEAIDELAPAGSGRPRKLVANLPYVVATPVIVLFLLDERPWERFVVTIQKELADRLLARPGTKDYGSVSVLAQALGDVELLRVLPPSAFWPRPKVASAFLRITPRAEKRARVRDLRTFHQFTRGVMLHRRKVLRGALHGLLPNLSKPEIDQFLCRMGVDPGVRAESIDPDEMIRIANELPGDWFAAAERT